MSRHNSRFARLFLTALFIVLCSTTVFAGAPQLHPLGKLKSCDSVTTGIGVDNAGNLFLSKAKLDTVSKFDLYGRNLRHFKPLKISRGGLAVAPLGDVIYAAAGQAVLVLNGDTGEQIGYLGEGEGEFKSIFALSLDDVGRVYVADRGSRSVRVYSPQGKFLFDFAIAAGTGQVVDLSAMAIDRANGQLWLAYAGEPAIAVIYDLEGRQQKTLSAATAFGRSPIGSFSAIAFDPQGRLFVLDYKQKEIRSFDFRTGGEASCPWNNIGAGEKGDCAGLVYDAVTSRLFVYIDKEVFILSVDNASGTQSVATQ